MSHLSSHYLKCSHAEPGLETASRQSDSVSSTCCCRAASGFHRSFAAGCGRTLHNTQRGWHFAATIPLGAKLAVVCVRRAPPWRFLAAAGVDLGAARGASPPARESACVAHSSGWRTRRGAAEWFVVGCVVSLFFRFCRPTCGVAVSIGAPPIQQERPAYRSSCRSGGVLVGSVRALAAISLR